MIDVYKNILDCVIDNGRCSSDADEFIASLEVEVEFEALERGLTPDQTAEAIEFAKAHVKN